MEAMLFFRENIGIQTQMKERIGKSEVIFLSEDRQTKGNWMEKYGKLGYHVVGAQKRLPDGLQENGYVIRDAVCVLLKMNVPEKEALCYGEKKRVAAYYLSGESFWIHIRLKDNIRQTVSFYFLDYDHLERQESVEVIRSDTGQVIDKKVLTDFYGGIYLSYQVEGEIAVRITKINGPDAVISGIFWDDAV